MYFSRRYGIPVTESQGGLTHLSPCALGSLPPAHGRVAAEAAGYSHRQSRWRPLLNLDSHQLHRPGRALRSRIDSNGGFIFYVGNVLHASRSGDHSRRIVERLKVTQDNTRNHLRRRWLTLEAWDELFNVLHECTLRFAPLVHHMLYEVCDLRPMGFIGGHLMVLGHGAF